MKANSEMWFVLLLIITKIYATIPLPASPSWTSIDQDYSTGGGFADINNDGYIDFCTSNGNDMAWNKQGIYFNNTGVLVNQANWRSADSGMFGHLYLGDVNNDGLIDMAVAYLGPQGDCKTRIYYNMGNGLSNLPTWVSTDTDSSFDCALGDVDLDGDLDLAVTAGDAYSGRRAPAKIYRNNNGAFEPLPYWSAIDSTPSDAIRFADLNRDGYLDLIVGGRRKLWVYNNQNGVFPQTANWTITGNMWVLRIATADYDNDSWIDVAVAENGQLSGDSSRIRIYKNNNGQLSTTPIYTMRRNSQYCSCVAWADVNNDGYLDLAAGGWWEPIVVFKNRNGVLDTSPNWSWNGGFNLVCEALVWGDIRNYHLVSIVDTFIGNGTRKLFYTRKSPIQQFTGISVHDSIIPESDFCYDALTGWVSLTSAPANDDTIMIRYQYSTHPDLAVTNWTQPSGNYLFLNITPQAVTQEAQPITYKHFDLTVVPNPFLNNVRFEIANGDAKIEIYNIVGNLIKILSSKPFIWNCQDEFSNKIPNGIYFVKATFNNAVITKKIVKLK